MPAKILVLGGYGNFGGIISTSLGRDAAFQILVGGRSQAAAQKFCDQQPTRNFTAAVIDVAAADFPEKLAAYAPQLVIHTCGPYQAQQYTVAKACIALGIHYIDLSDGRDFVANFSTLHKEAAQKSVVAISGASTVPCLSAAIIENFLAQFSELETVDYGISPGYANLPGPATIKSILSYIGKPFSTLKNGTPKQIYGWQNLARIKIPSLGARWVGNCDIPDLSLLPARYAQLKTIHFRAGIEVGIIHWGLWLISWLVRGGIIRNLERYADLLFKISLWFGIFGSDRGSMYFNMSGTDKQQRPLKITWHIVATHGDGPNIPCAPSIILARKILKGGVVAPGAYACTGFVSLDEYMEVLSGLHIHTATENPASI